MFWFRIFCSASAFSFFSCFDLKGFCTSCFKRCPCSPAYPCTVENEQSCMEKHEHLLIKYEHAVKYEPAHLVHHRRPCFRASKTYSRWPTFPTSRSTSRVRLKTQRETIRTCSERTLVGAKLYACLRQATTSPVRLMSSARPIKVFAFQVFL